MKTKEQNIMTATTQSLMHSTWTRFITIVLPTTIRHYPRRDSRKVRLDVLPEKILYKSYLNRDEARPHAWKRNNQFLIYDGEISSEEYYEAVLMLACGYWRNQKINSTASDERRSDIRYRNGWDGVGILYDACLLIEIKRREQFDYEAFIKKYPLEKISTGNVK